MKMSRRSSMIGAAMTSFLSSAEATPNTKLESPLFPIVDGDNVCMVRVGFNEGSLWEHTTGVSTKDGFPIESVTHAEDHLLRHVARKHIEEINLVDSYRRTKFATVSYFVLVLPTLLERLDRISGLSRRGPGNIILMHPQIAALMPYMNDCSSNKCGRWNYVAKINEKTIFASDCMPKNEIVIAYIGRTESDKIVDGPAVVLRINESLTLVPLNKRNTALGSAEDYFQTFRFNLLQT